MTSIQAYRLIFTVLLVWALAGSCTRQVSTAPVNAPSKLTPTVTATPSIASTADLTQEPPGMILEATNTLPPTLHSTPQIIIESVQVIQGSGVYVRGITSLMDGECIQTSLLANNQPETWWPQDLCVEAESGQWEILVSLGRRSAPQVLDAGTEYQIQAWWLKSPQDTLVFFPFDLSGPPGPD